MTRLFSLEKKAIKLASCALVLTCLLGSASFAGHAATGENAFLTAGYSASQNPAEQSPKTVTGTVIDSNGEPVVGANILERGTKNGVFADVDGKFSISVGSDAVLEISSIGFITQQVSVRGRTSFEIVLPCDTRSLDEVVVVGYGSVKRQNLTSSVSKITDEAVKERPIASVSEALQGQLAGVRSYAGEGGVPGYDMTIQIRGTNTINGDSSPLYVIDGVPRENMSDLNPSDIASIQVLKDASASAIYGSRGANGVILIETKQGQGKPVISFEGYGGISTAEKKLDMMTGPEYVAWNMYKRNVSYLRSGGSMSDPMSMRPAGNQIPDYWLTTNEFTDWQDEILQTAAFQNYQVSASAKGDIGSIYFSVGYMDQQGIIIETYYKRINARLNSTINVSKNITAGINMSFSQGNRDGADSNKGANGGGKESSIHHALMVTPLMKMTEGTKDWGFPANVGTTYPNPAEQLKQTTDRTKNTRMATSLWGQYRIIDGLNFKSQFSYNYDGQVYEYFQPVNVVYNGASSVGYSNSSTTNDWVWQNTLTYDKSFGLHNLNVMAGQSIEKRKYYRINAQATNFPYESIETLNVATTPTVATTRRTTYTNASVFGRASYNYAEKYLLTASIRYDGSSRFGTNNQWGLFPSVSAGWKINEENFMKGIDWINLMKVRASWGKAGNDRIGDYAYMALLSVVNTSWGDAVSPGIAPSNMANEDLQWETTETVDLGFDMSLLQNRIQLNLDWYLNTTKDLLFSVPIPYTTGFSAMTKNIGSIQNKGWEIDLTSHNLVGAFTWSTNLNLSRNKNEVLDMGDVKSFTTDLWDTRFLTEVGKPISQFYSYKTGGLLKDSDFDANGYATIPILKGQEPGNVKYVDVNGDGTINSGDWVVHGNYQPKLSWGMTNRFGLKNFDLSILMQGQFGGKVLFMGQRQYDNGSGGVNNFARWLRCYKPDYEAKYGAGEDPIPWDYIKKHNIDFSFDGKTPNPFGNNTNDDDRRVYSSDYMRIKNITLGYTFPKKFLSKTVISSARVYISLDNVKKFDNYPAFSPETNSFGNNTTAQGVDYSTYPLSKRAIFGINITF